MSVKSVKASPQRASKVGELTTAVAEHSLSKCWIAVGLALTEIKRTFNH